MDATFSTHTASYLNSILGSIADYVRNNTAELATLSSDEIVLRIRTKVAIPVSHVAHPPSFLPPSLVPLQGPAIPLALGGMAAPQLNGLAAPSASKPSAGGATKAAKLSQRNITVDEYRIEHARRDPVCSYRPNRGVTRALVCGAPAINIPMEPNPFKWRCACCTGKAGDITKAMGPAQGVVAPSLQSAGFNIPTGINVMPKLGVQTSALPQSNIGLNALSALPGMPQLPGMGLGGMPQLPGMGLGGMPRMGLGSMPGVPSGSVYGVQSISLDMPQLPPALPTLGAPLPSTIEEGRLPVIMNSRVPKYYFVSVHPHQGIVVKESTTDDALYFLGKCVDEQGVGLPITEKTPLDPETWSLGLVQPNAEDIVFLKRYGVLNNFMLSNPTPGPFP